MPLKFTFREAPLKIKNAKAADANAIGQELQRITLANGGRLTTKAALDAARSTRSPLHRHIEWRDKVAAEAYRQQQVGELIRLIVREDTDDYSKPMARAFLSIHDKSGTAYRTVDEVLGSRDLQLRVLQQAHRDLTAWEHRYEDLSEVCGLVRAARTRLEREITETTTQEARPS